MTTHRRSFLLGGTAAVALGAFAWALRPQDGALAAEGSFEISATEAEWREKLTAEQFAVLREEGTERPWSSPLLEEHREGTFDCAGCDQPLFSSAVKYDSGTGWPSFWEPLPGAVGESEDNKLGMVRTEVHCSRCGGHLGHVFTDGPEPTGLRYCMNGLAMTFTPAQA